MLARQGRKQGRLTRSEWEPLAQAHEARVDALVAPHLARRRSGVKHPVHDFLFTYYSQRPAQLRRWHPGAGVTLEDAGDREDWKGYEVLDGRARVSPAYVATLRPLLESTLAVLTATAARTAHFGCFGLHEWAMVHRLAEDTTRHPDWPLRLGPDGTDRVVESHRIACSHFDAYRFFTPSARPLNVLRPGPDDRAAYEQPGCLHGNMDLYKHAFRLSPMVPSELVTDCFELARDIRILDMRAAPYDLTGLILEPTGDEWTPVRIETPEGKREYAEAQRVFADRAVLIRQRLLDACEGLLGACPSVSSPDTGDYGLGMAADEERPDRFEPHQDYRTLPTTVRLDETIASVDAHSVLDPDAVRNVDQHEALRDD